MGQSWPHELGVGQVTKPGRLQTGPPEQVTRGGRFDRDERVILERPEQMPRFHRFPLHLWSLFARSIFALSRRMSGPAPPPCSLWVHKQPWPFGEELYAVQSRSNGRESAQVRC